MKLFSSVRFKLTFWYLAVFGLVLLLFSGFMYVSISRTLSRRLDDALAGAIETASSELSDEVSENHGDAGSGARETVSEVKLVKIEITIGQGRRVLASNSPNAAELLDRAPTRAARELIFETDRTAGRVGSRFACIRQQTIGGDCVVIASESLEELDGQLASIGRLFLLGLAGAMLVAGFGGAMLAKKSLSPIVTMSAQARRISATNLNERLAVANSSDELGRLASVINDLLSRLEASFSGMRQFMADASHELRTPLSIIRGEADVALSEPRGAEDYRQALEVIQDEAVRLTAMVADLLELARADAGQRPLAVTRFYLNDVVEESFRSVHVLGVAKGVSLEMGDLAEVAFSGDEDLIRRMIRNLLDNAIKYTCTGGSVRVEMCANAGYANIAVSDTGVGIAAGATDRVFGRFFRDQQGRREHPHGAGLGLAIARWIVESHHGTIGVTSAVGEGSRFTVSLPIEKLKV